MSNVVELGGQWKRSINGAPIDFVPVPGSYAPLGECVLSREFEVRSHNQGRLFLCTEGVLAWAQFAINGEVVGQAGPFVPYRFEIPARLLGAHNRVDARVRDIIESFGPQPGRKFHGGLARKIYIESRPAAFIEHIRFHADVNPELSAAACTVDVAINGAFSGRLAATLTHRSSGQIVARAHADAKDTLRFSVAQPRLWSPETPELYLLSARLEGAECDEMQEFVGFRRIEIRGSDFFLNNRRLFLKGICRHEFNEQHGYSPPEDVIRRELSAIKQAGFNFMRLVHSPQSPAVPRIAAELGLLCSEEPGTCFHDLGDEKIAAPAIGTLRRVVLRDRNVPSVFAWLIYNECNPHTGYAVRAAQACREVDPDRLLTMADCSGQHDKIKQMVTEANLSFYGINLYTYEPRFYSERMALYADRPLVFTEWGGCWGGGNERVLRWQCEILAAHARTEAAVKFAGCCFWVWADYEERTHGMPSTEDGVTLEGLVDINGSPKPDLQIISSLLQQIDAPAPRTPASFEVLAQLPPRPEPWQCVPLESCLPNNAQLEEQLDKLLATRTHQMPAFGGIVTAGVPFACCASSRNFPLLLGRGRELIEIPVSRKVRRLAVLGQVALSGGYPADNLWSVHHGAAAPRKDFASAASEYELDFDQGSERQTLAHGVQVLRANNICRWWTTQPRSPELIPALQTTLREGWYVLRFDVWFKEFDTPRQLETIRWRLKDPDSLQALLALSVSE